MFFLLAIISMLGYSVQVTLLAKYARKVDGLSLAVYRNLSLGLTMLPVFFFVKPGDMMLLQQVWKFVVLGSVCGTIGLAFSLSAQKALPVAIQTAFTQMRVVYLFVWAALFLHEYVSFLKIFAASIVIFGAIYLALQKHHMSHLNGKVRQAIFFSFFASFFVSFAFFFMSLAARKANPLLVGYFWELGIGVFAFLFLFFPSLQPQKTLQKIPFQMVLGITLVSSFTLIGTGAYALAITYGSIALASAIGGSGIVVITLLSHYLYHEKLSRKQLFGMGIIIAGVVFLKLVS